MSVTVPFLVPANVNATAYDGIVVVNDREFDFRLELAHVSPNGQVRKAGLYGCPELRELLKGQENILIQRLEQCENVDDFGRELKDILTRLVLSNRRCADEPTYLSRMPNSEYYMAVVSELDVVGWDALVYIDLASGRLQLSVRDSASRSHAIDIKLPEDYPSSPPTCQVQLPDPAAGARIVAKIETTSRKSGRWLGNVLGQFAKELVAYQHMWAMLDDLDAKTWILEPEKPTRDCTLRRLALGNHRSLQVDMNVQDSKGIPDIRLFGSEAAIAPLRSALNRNLRLWSAAKFTRENLQTILETTFPSPRSSNPSKETSDLSVECGICYSFRLDGDTPEINCSNGRCGQPFHKRCLFEWLRSDPQSRQSFNTLFGHCPYCMDPITTTTVN